MKSIIRTANVLIVIVTVGLCLAIGCKKDDPAGPDNNLPSEPSQPTPANGAVDLPTNVTLNWVCSDPNGGAMTYDIYFGTTVTPPIVQQEYALQSYTPRNLRSGTTYYWKISAYDNHENLTKGPLWQFTTANLEPFEPNSPYPGDGSTNRPLDLVLTWSCYDPEYDPLIFDVYFGNSNPPPLVQSELGETTYDPGDINSNTEYFWKITAKDNHDHSITGPIWSFITEDTTAFYEFERDLEGHTNHVISIAFKPDGLLLASGSIDNSIRLWQVSNGGLDRTINAGYGNGVQSIAFNPTESMLASAIDDRNPEQRFLIKLWYPSDGSLLRTLTGHSYFVESVAFSPDGLLLASGSADMTIKIWRLSDGSLINTLTGHSYIVESVAFSPDGSLLASGSGDNTIKLWRVTEGSLIRTLEGHSLGVESISFSPDGLLLASGSMDQSIKLWRVSDGTLIRTISAHIDGVTSVAFSPDGVILASGSRLSGGSSDASAKLWRVADGTLIRNLGADINWVFAVAFSPDGTRLAIAGDNKIMIYRHR